MIGKTFIHFLGVRAGLSQPHTQTTASERNVIASYLPGAKRIVEVGVFEGYTTRLLAEKSDTDAVIYGVDPFFAGRLGISWGMLIARHCNERYLRSGKVQFVRRLSTDVGGEVPNPVDVVFIDGDHSLAGITMDWAFWSERLAKGGIVALHDTLVTPDKPEAYTLGSIEYFRDHIRHDPRFDILVQQDSLSVLKKRW